MKLEPLSSEFLVLFPKMFVKQQHCDRNRFYDCSKYKFRLFTDLKNCENCDFHSVGSVDIYWAYKCGDRNLYYTKLIGLY